MQCALEIRDLKAGYGRPVIQGFTLKAFGGQLINVYGGNGSGKTTLLKVFIGAVPAVGEVRVYSTDILMLSSVDRVKYISVAFAEPLRADITVKRYFQLANTPKWYEIAERLGISHLLDKPLRELSTGQNRKVQLTRALSSAAPVIALDEPFSNLDEESQRELRSIISELLRMGRTVLITSHSKLGAHVEVGLSC